MSGRDEDTTTTTTTTVKAKTVAEQYRDNDLPNPDPAHAAPTTDLNASGSVASPDVENPANDPTTNDTTQTHEERLAQARQTAVTNHEAAKATGTAGDQNASEEKAA